MCSASWWACAGMPGPKFAAGTPRAAKRATSVHACFGRTSSGGALWSGWIRRCTIDESSAAGLLGATAEVVARGFDRYRDDGHAGSDITVYAFEATVLINGNEHRMRREVGSQRAFYEPWIVDGDGLRQGHAGRRCHRHAQGTGFRSGHGGAIARGRRRLARG